MPNVFAFPPDVTAALNNADGPAADNPFVTRARLPVNVRDHGAHPSALPATNDAAFAAAKIAAAGGVLYFPAGTYEYSETLAWGGNHVAYRGGPGVVLKFTGTGNAIEFDAGAGDLVLAALEGFAIYGNANCTNAIYCRRQHGLKLRDIYVRDVSGAGLAIYGSVLGTIENFTVSPAGTAYTTTPVNGIIIGDSGGKSTTQTIITPDINGVSGTGIKFEGSAFCNVLGGTSEGNARGVELTTDAAGIQLFTMDLEANSVDDVLCNGHSCGFHGMDCVDDFNIGSSAFNTQIMGGLFKTISIASGATRTTIENVIYNFTATGTFTDAGTFTQFRNVVNGSSGLARSQSMIEDFGLSSDSRNWAWKPSETVHGAYGWLSLMRSTARGGDPFAGDTALHVTNGNSLGLGVADAAGAFNAIAIPNTVGGPGTPAGGGVLYVDNGALRYKGSSGTDTVIASA